MDKFGEAEQQLRDEILKNFRSVRAFCSAYEIPYSTVDNIFRRGLSGVTISTAIQICDTLGLDIEAFSQGRIAKAAVSVKQYPLSTEEQQLLDDYRLLDGHGKEMVKTILEKETQRMNNEELWERFVGMPIACRGGMTKATENDARQLAKLFADLIKQEKK